MATAQETRPMMFLQELDAVLPLQEVQQQQYHCGISGLMTHKLKCFQKAT